MQLKGYDIENHKFEEDHEIIARILTIIYNYNVNNSYALLKQVIDTDRSLSLFFQLTGYNPRNTPKLIVNFIN